MTERGISAVSLGSDMARYKHERETKWIICDLNFEVVKTLPSRCNDIKSSDHGLAFMIVSNGLQWFTTLRTCGTLNDIYMSG